MTTIILLDIYVYVYKKILKIFGGAMAPLCPLKGPSLVFGLINYQDAVILWICSGTVWRQWWWVVGDYEDEARGGR